VSVPCPWSFLAYVTLILRFIIIIMMMMSGNCWNKNVFRLKGWDRWWWLDMDCKQCVPDDCSYNRITVSERSERRPMVVRRYDGKNSSSVDDDRRRRRPGRSDTWTSWFKYAGATSCYTRYAIWDLETSLMVHMCKPWQWISSTSIIEHQNFQWVVICKS